MLSYATAPVTIALTLHIVTPATACRRRCGTRVLKREPESIAMRRECIFIVWRLTLVFLLLYSASFHTGGESQSQIPQVSAEWHGENCVKMVCEIIAEESGREYSKGCAHLQCESGSQCIKRRFWCKNPPCPGMLYCSKSRKGEDIRGKRVDHSLALLFSRTSIPPHFTLAPVSLRYYLVFLHKCRFAR